MYSILYFKIMKNAGWALLADVRDWKELGVRQRPIRAQFTIQQQETDPLHGATLNDIVWPCLRTLDLLQSFMGFLYLEQPTSLAVRIQECCCLGLKKMQLHTSLTPCELKLAAPVAFHLWTCPLTTTGSVCKMAKTGGRLTSNRTIRSRYISH